MIPAAELRLPRQCSAVETASLESYLNVANAAFYPEHPDVISLKSPVPGAR